MEYKKADTLLKVTNVSKNYGEKKVLRNINFEIKDIIRPECVQGQVCALLGASGAGKSTLFNILAGLSQPTSGEVLAGIPLKPVYAGEMGVVYQNYYLYPWEKINNILLMAVNKNPSIKREERKDAIKNIASDFNIGEHLDKYPSELSGGQKQRVALAEQILCGNEFILLDEPFSGLDILTIDKVEDFLIKVSLSDELKTLIIVSHDLPNTCAISDTIFVLAKEKDSEGKFIEGATIVKEINMIDRDLAWHKDVKDRPGFKETLKEIKSLL